MPSIPLPENASLEHIRNQAKLVQNPVRSGDQGGLDLVQELHPRAARALADPAGFKRTDAQLAVARLYGFTSWDRLSIAALAAAGQHRRLADVLAADLDLDLDRPVGRSRRPPVEIARAQGHDELVDILVSAGATRPARGPEEDR